MQLEGPLQAEQLPLHDWHDPLSRNDPG